MKRRHVLVLIVALACLAFVFAIPGERNEGADVHIVFSGLISHLFADGHAPRSVVMRGDDTMPHRATLYISESAIASSQVALNCKYGECAFDLTNAAIRFENSGRARVTRDGSFDRITPHLRAVTNGEMRELRADLFDDVPSPSSPISASIALPFGRMSAVAYDEKGHYEPDFENRGERQFAREVFFDGHVASPKLMLRRAGDASWRSIEFKKDALIELRIVNEPLPGTHPALMHAMLYYDLAKTPLAERPTIVVDASRIRAESVSVGCSNSQWP